MHLASIPAWARPHAARAVLRSGAARRAALRAAGVAVAGADAGAVRREDRQGAGGAGGGTDLELAQPWTLKKGGEKIFTAPRGVGAAVLRAEPQRAPPRPARGLPADARRAGAGDVRPDRRHASRRLGPLAPPAGQCTAAPRSTTAIHSRSATSRCTSCSHTGASSSTLRPPSAACRPASSATRDPGADRSARAVPPSIGRRGATTISASADDRRPASDGSPAGAAARATSATDPARSACASDVRREQRVAERGDGAAHARPRARRAPAAPTIARAPAAAGERHADRARRSSQRAVSVIAPSSRNVLARCTAMNSARARLALSATSSNSTRPAPTPASVSMKSIDQPAARARRMPGRPRSPDGDDERQQGDQRQPAGEAVGELDEGRDRRRARHDLAVAERPVLAAAGARSGGAHVGTPADHHEVPGDDDPREPGQPGIHGVLRIV